MSLSKCLLLGFSLSIAACSASNERRAPPAEKSSPAAVVLVNTAHNTIQSSGSIRYDLDRKTTSIEIALKNLSGQIESSKELLKKNPLDLPLRERLIHSLSARTQFLGTFADFQVVEALLVEAEGLPLDKGRVAKLRGQFLSSVHRFDDALKSLDKADALGQKTGALRQTIALAKGQGSAEEIATRLKDTVDAASYGSFTKLAAAYTADGQYQKADEAYQQALDLYRDVSPFPLAWVAFQRGMMWGESAGDKEKAYHFYKAAVARFPGYIVANVHLSELEVERGMRDVAIKRLARLVDTTDDPEPASRLAEYLASSDTAAAKRYANQAEEGYAKLLANYPLAFSDHACEFYLGAGDDAAKALSLAQLNLNNRKTKRAYALAYQAALASDDAALSCALASGAGVEKEKSCI